MTTSGIRRRRASLAVLGGVAALAATLAISAAYAGTKEPAHHSPPLTTPSTIAFHDAMRKLWEDHITWTRNVIISFQVNVPDAPLPDLSTALGRLLQNQVDIGAAIKPYYGDAAGTRLSELLTEHIVVAGAILQAAKTGDEEALAAAKASWYENARAIAAFLHAANPDHWSLAEMETMMRDHLEKTTAEVVARLDGDWAADVRAYDAAHEQALEMADMLSGGIIAQFPSKFRP